MKKLILGLIITLFYTQGQAQDSRTKAGAILDAMAKRYKTMTAFSASFSYNTDGVGGAVYKGDITVKGTKFRLKTSGQEIFNNGQKVATYIKENNEVTISDYEPSDADLNPAKIYAFEKKGYRYVFVEELKEGSQVYEVLELSPEKKGGKISKVKIKLNKSDKSVKSWIITDKDGKKQVFKVDKFVPNVPVTDTFFTFDKSKYPGVEVIDLD
jgi:outer membrane lipoprotein carrier protein